MGRILLINAVMVGALLLAWYVIFARLNRDRAVGAIDRVRLAWRGKVLGMRWHGWSRVHAGLQLPSSLFRGAHLTLQLLPRPVPFHWLLSRWREQQETLTIEADLDQPPGFSLEVHNHHWRGWAGSKRATERKRNWKTARPGPVVLTTCHEWQSEFSPALSALMVLRGSDFVDVRLRPQSPHLTATLLLDSVPDHEAAVHMLHTLREVASGARAAQD